MNEGQDETVRIPSEVLAHWERQLNHLEDKTYSSTKSQDDMTHKSGRNMPKGP